MIDLIASHCSAQQRVHTFGVGHGASEELIKQAAFKGLGHFAFIYNEAEIEEQVVSALAKTRLNYLVLQNAILFDAEGCQVESKRLSKRVEPVLEASPVELTCMLEPGQKSATSFRIQLLDPSTQSVNVFYGPIMPI